MERRNLDSRRAGGDVVEDGGWACPGWTGLVIARAKQEPACSAAQRRKGTAVSNHRNVTDAVQL